MESADSVIHRLREYGVNLNDADIAQKIFQLDVLLEIFYAGNHKNIPRTICQRYTKVSKNKFFHNIRIMAIAAYRLEVNMLTRRDFFRFFLIGGILSLLRKKVKAEQKPKEAMFWKRID
jgi:hypothetical protein